MMTDNRRKLKTRQSSIAQIIAKWLSSKSISPNQISILSVFFAGLGAACLFYLPQVKGNLLWVLALVAAACIQCRLLCNLFDGMVAVEGGKGTPAGELFNDIPDRIADILLFVGSGYAVADFNEQALILGWCTALGAVLTAYVRTLATSIGAPTDFCGPMAKQHRMFVLTVACTLTPLERFIGVSEGTVLFTALCLIGLGSLVTVVRRARRAYRFLENKVV